MGDTLTINSCHFDDPFPVNSDYKNMVRIFWSDIIYFIILCKFDNFGKASLIMGELTIFILEFRTVDSLTWPVKLIFDTLIVSD